MEQDDDDPPEYRRKLRQHHPCSWWFVILGDQHLWRAAEPIPAASLVLVPDLIQAIFVRNRRAAANPSLFEPSSW